MMKTMAPAAGVVAIWCGRWLRHAPRKARLRRPGNRRVGSNQVHDAVVANTSGRMAAKRRILPAIAVGFCGLGIIAARYRDHFAGDVRQHDLRVSTRPVARLRIDRQICI